MVKMFEFEVTGISTVVGNVERIKKDLYAQIQESMADYMIRVLSKAQELCPVDTGKLIESLHVGQESEFTWYLADGVPYGIYQEVGFFHKGAGRFIQNPFAMPAFYSTAPPIIKLR